MKPRTAWTALAIVLLLASLSLVTWRQTQARALYETLDSLRGTQEMLRAEIRALETEITRLESRARVEEAAEVRLGMHRSTTEERIDLLEPLQ